MKSGYYFDTCIWLNLFKKEESFFGPVSFWKVALDFIESIENKNEVIYVSVIVLKELYFVAPEKFMEIKKFFKQSNYIKIIKTIPEDYNLAREFEKQDNFNLSFYDYLHIAIVKKLDCNFITRDKDLVEFAKDKVRVNKPEDLIS